MVSENFMFFYLFIGGQAAKNRGKRARFLADAPPRGSLLLLGRRESMLFNSFLLRELCCNTPDVTFHICNSNSCHFRLCVMIFPPWLGFVSVCCYRCLASHIMSSCASHLHTCSSHASEHFPRCPFCNPTLPHTPAHPSCLFS